MVYIMFLVFTLGNYAGGDAERELKFSAEFNTKEACVSAGTVIQQQLNRRARLFTCLPKGAAK